MSCLGRESARRLRPVGDRTTSVLPHLRCPFTNNPAIDSVYAALSLISNAVCGAVLVLGINCMTHGAFEKYDTDLNEYGIEVQNKSRTTNSMIPMSAQQAFQGRLTDLANGIVSRLVSPQCAALLGGGSVWHTACARINHTNTWEHVHIRTCETHFHLPPCVPCLQAATNQQLESSSQFSGLYRTW